MKNVKMVKLGEISRIVSGATPRRNKPELWGAGINWVTPKDISKLEGTTLFKTPEQITDKGYGSCSTTILQIGSVIFSCRAPIGLVALTGTEMCTNQGFKSLVPSPKVDSSYLYWCMRFLAPQIAKQGRGATFKEVSKSQMEDFLVPFISDLPEQRRIAEILDLADAARRKRRENLSLYDDLIRSLFLKTFGDPVSNPMGWKTKKLGDWGSVVTGNTPSRKDPENYGSFIEWIKSDNINTPYYLLTESKEMLSKKGVKIGRTVPAGSLLITCIAGSKSCIGNVGVADRDVSFNQQINALTPESTDWTPYLYCHFIVGKKLVQRASTNGMKGLVSKSAFSDVEFLDPPEDLIIEFAGKAKESNAQKSREQVLCDQHDDLFNALLQRAFKGEL